MTMKIINFSLFHKEKKKETTGISSYTYTYYTVYKLKGLTRFHTQLKFHAFHIFVAKFYLPYSFDLYRS